MSSVTFQPFFDSNTFRRLSVRLILIGFATFLMCSITCLTQNYLVLTYSCGILAIAIEGSVSLYFQFRGKWKEFKWFSPSIMLFIVTCIPILSILKQHQLHVSQIFKQTNIELLLKRDMIYCFDKTFQSQMIHRDRPKYPSYTFKCSKDRLVSFNKDNFKLMCSLLTNIQYRQCHSSEICRPQSSSIILWSFMKNSCSRWRDLINHLTLIGILSDELAGFMLIEQLLLLVLVIVNWIWPQTESSHEIYFAQMLRQYLAAAPDIVEFYGNFYQGENLNQLEDQNLLQIAIFVIFIVSTFQFSINLQMKRKSTAIAHQKPFCRLNFGEKCLVLYELVFCTSMWSVIFITLTQDLPFLVIRWYFLSTSLHRRTTISTISDDLLSSCNTTCCTSNGLNRTNISTVCEVTMRSLSGMCIGRVCYFGECDGFASSINTTDDYMLKNRTINANTSHLSFSPLINRTKTGWYSWIDRTGLTIRHIILIILFITSISLTLLTLIVVIKAIRQANIIGDRKAYRYTLL